MAVLRTNVMSRKSTTFFGFNGDLQAVVFEDFVQVASPSSLYNPTLTSWWVRWDNRNSLISWQVSAPSKLPIVTSKSDLILRHDVIVIKGGLFYVLDNHPFISRDFYVMKGEI